MNLSSRLNNVIIGLVIEDIDIVVDFILYAGIHTGTVKREILYEELNIYIINILLFLKCR